MVSCDRCINPGRCCNGFSLFNPEIAEPSDPEEVQKALDAHISYMDGDLSKAVSREIKADFSVEEIVAFLKEKGVEHVQIGLPFKFLGRLGNTNLFGCKNLGADGRCTDYENRPSICRAFAPGSSPVCVMRED